jgi:hypothetical protein
MSQANFQIAYDGEAIQDGTIDVRILAPALLSLGDLVNASNEILNGESATTALRVESSFQGGSFEVSLILNQTLLETVKGLFASHGTIDAAGLLSAIFGIGQATAGTVQGLLRAYKILRGEQPNATLIDQSSHTSIFVLGNGNEVRVEKATADLYGSKRVLDAADKVLSPLSGTGINVFEVREHKEVIDRLERGDLPKRLLEPKEFTLEEPEGSKLSSTREVLVRITKPALEGGRWSLSDGQAKFGAVIEDAEFNQRVKQREEGFFAGDTLHVLLKTSQKIAKDNTLTVTHVIERVLHHTHAPQESTLPFNNSEAPQLTEGEKKSLPPSQE